MEESFYSLYYISWLFLLHNQNKVITRHVNTMALVAIFIVLSRLSLPYYDSHSLVQAPVACLGLLLSYLAIIMLVIGRHHWWPLPMNLMASFSSRNSVVYYPFAYRNLALSSRPLYQRTWFLASAYMLELGYLVTCHIMDFGIPTDLSYKFLLSPSTYDIVLYFSVFSKKESSNSLLETCLSIDYWVIDPRFIIYLIIFGSIFDIAYYLSVLLPLGFCISIYLCMSLTVYQALHLSHAVYSEIDHPRWANQILTHGNYCHPFISIVGLIGLLGSYYHIWKGLWMTYRVSL